MNTSQDRYTIEADLGDLMVTVPSGAITLRDDRINKSWSVDIKSFELAKYPVTQWLYHEVMGTNPSSFEGEQNPVETVSWMDAVAFCNALSKRFDLIACYEVLRNVDHIRFHADANGFRLPTEAEWQYACQAGSGKNRYNDLATIAWYKDNALDQPHEVGLKSPNDWGFYDMLGNVWEWCSDIYDETVYGSYRIFRGGGWCDTERSVMSTTRRRSHPSSFRIDDLGFRIARNLATPH